jgi:nitrogen fixation/metabolism regulation signal transduction histidine kinase
MAPGFIVPRFTLYLLLRLALIIFTMVIFMSIVNDRELLFNKVILAIIFVAQVGELVYAIGHTNRQLARLFHSIRYSDFTVLFDSKSLGSSFRDLEENLTGVVQSFRQAKIDKEVQFQFLQKLVEQLTVGVIALHNNEVELINSTAQRLLGARGVTNWKLIRSHDSKVVAEIEQLGPAGRKLVELKEAGVARTLAVEVTTIIILGEPHRVITIQDINSEIEQKEMEAWQRLIRILTHEIMNSVTPVSSLTETMQSMLTGKDGKQKELTAINDETVSDILFSLQTVQKRSEGLLNFVDSYRKVTRVPKPVPIPTSIATMIESIATLMKPELNLHQITITTSTEDGLTALLDEKLIEQVLINLVTNSIHALENRDARRVDLKAYAADGHAVIEVTDNGKGIPDKELPEIFIPFFSTRESGSGIGLSLSKQIMSAHGGNIRVKSVEGMGTSFYLHFLQQ